MNFYIFLYVSSFLIALGADDWFLIWAALEVNMMVFIVIVYEQYSYTHIEVCLKYFFIQSLGSGILMGVFYLNKDLFLYFGSVILSYKIGAGPFFFWFPSVACGLGWGSCFVLFSFQKIIPLMLVVMFIGWMIWLILTISLIFGVLGSLNQIHLKRLLAYSSIHHVGWLLMCNVVDTKTWLVYLLMYMFVTLTVILILSYFEIENLLSINKFKSKLWFLISMLSLGGMPPFLGFFLKWFAFVCFLKMSSWIVLIMVIMSVIMFYVYSRIIYNTLVGYGKEMSWLNYMLLKFYKKIDLMSVLGMISGTLFGLWIMM